jgi:hypothetical protein
VERDQEDQALLRAARPARRGLVRGVYVYVKQLYKRFNANSRGELLARFIRGNLAGPDA